MFSLEMHEERWRIRVVTGSAAAVTAEVRGSVEEGCCNGSSSSTVVSGWFLGRNSQAGIFVVVSYMYFSGISIL